MGRRPPLGDSVSNRAAGFKRDRGSLGGGAPSGRAAGFNSQNQPDDNSVRGSVRYAGPSGQNAMLGTQNSFGGMSSDIPMMNQS